MEFKDSLQSFQNRVSSLQEEMQLQRVKCTNTEKEILSLKSNVTTLGNQELMQRRKSNVAFVEGKIDLIAREENALKNARMTRVTAERKEAWVESLKVEKSSLKEEIKKMKQFKNKLENDLRNGVHGSKSTIADRTTTESSAGIDSDHKLDQSASVSTNVECYEKKLESFQQELDQLLTVVLEDQNQLNKNVSDLKIFCSKMATLEAERNQFTQRNPQSNESRCPKVQLNLNDQDPKPTREVKIEPHSNIKEKIVLAECDIDAKNEQLKEALLDFDAIMQSDFNEMKTKDEKMTMIKSLREKLEVENYESI